LLVEDNDASSRGLAKLLGVLGYQVTVAADGASALLELEKRPPPDVLLTDLRLPDIDGREVASVASRLVPRPQVVLVTGWDIELESDDPQRWGIDCILTKPLDVQHLVANLRKPVDGDGDGQNASHDGARQSRADDSRTA
jgi:CheY-like chemotaxis protein